jgi:hypothetical protein
MTLIQWMKILIAKPRVYLPVLWQMIVIIRLKNNGIAKRNYGGEPERILFEERAGWIFNGGNKDELHHAFMHLPYETKRGNALDKDAPYSCSMRLIRLVYFIRMHDLPQRKILLSEFSCHAANDVQALASALEYRRATIHFSNHLLQNYCALLLYQTHFNETTDFINMKPVITQVETWLEKDWDILFRGSLRLYEGSSSYEILLLPILCNIACCGYNSPLTATIRAQLSSDIPSIVHEYCIDGEVVMPHIGDITPDYPAHIIKMFAETFAFNQHTIYRRLWHEELQALGL